MPHMMDDFPLLLSTLYERAVRLFPDQELVSVDAPGELRRATYAETDDRIRRLATALAERLGLGPGEAFGTFGWSTLRHHELYWAAANTGRICHTLNIRLHPDQLVYVIEHAGDRVVFVDPSLVGCLEAVASRLPKVERYVVMGEAVGDTTLPNAVAYEELLAEATPWGAWPRLDERSPMMLCYTSGTTGNPKGVAYTQRSTYLHALHVLCSFPVSAADVVVPVVPLFHAAGWGYPFSVVAAGGKLVYPGCDLSPAGLVRLFEEEQVTLSAGVPTVWLGLQGYLQEHPEAGLSSLRALLCGGAAVPRSMIDWFWRKSGVRVIQGWGMTETSPVAALSLLRPELEEAPWEAQLDRLESAGLPLLGLETKIVDGDGQRLPHDGEAFGELLVRGPWVTAGYYRDDRSPASFLDGWLKTGDVAKVTPDGYIRIVDRAKDVIKSGGEWISSVEIENALVAHHDVAEAAVIGAEHPKWQERPVAVVALRPGATADEATLLAHLEGKVARWWLPDRIVVVDAIPRTGTGKLDKKPLKERYRRLLVDAAAEAS